MGFALLAWAVAAAPGPAAVHFPGADWEVVAPRDEGLDPARLAAAAEYLKTNAGRDGVNELVVVRRGLDQADRKITDAVVGESLKQVRDAVRGRLAA